MNEFQHFSSPEDKFFCHGFWLPEALLTFQVHSNHQIRWLSFIPSTPAKLESFQPNKNLMDFLSQVLYSYILRYILLKSFPSYTRKNNNLGIKRSRLKEKWEKQTKKISSNCLFADYKVRKENAMKKIHSLFARFVEIFIIFLVRRYWIFFFSPSLLLQMVDDSFLRYCG